MEQQDQKDKIYIPGPPALADMMDVSIEDEIKKEEQERLSGKQPTRFPLSPSKFGGCAREMAIDLAEFEGIKIYPKIPIDSRGKRRFSRGYDIEYSLLKQFKQYVPIKQGFGQQYIAMDTTQDGKYVIGGSLDVMFMAEENMIVDIKSKATYYSSYMNDQFEETFAAISNTPGVTMFGQKAMFIEDIDKFYGEFSKDDFISRYIMQINSYGASDWAYSFKSNTNPAAVGIAAVSLLFENKNNHVMAEVRWKPSRKLYEKAITKAKEIYQWTVIDKNPPEEIPADFTLGSVACKLCSRRETCWGDERTPYAGPKKKWAVNSSQLINKDQVEKLYNEYKNCLPTKDKAYILEEELVKEIVNSKEDKIRMPDGMVFEVKYLKSPQPHFELRRGK